VNRFREIDPHYLPVALLLLLLAACSEPTAPKLSPLVGPLSNDQPVHTVRLPELLPVAGIEVDTLQIDFAHLRGDEQLLAGWSLERSQGKAWGLAQSSEVGFRLMTAGDLKLKLRCAPFHFPGSARRVLTVAVNGHELKSIRLWRMMRSYSVKVPETVLKYGANHLELIYSSSDVPAEVLANSNDHRDLAVRWESIRFQKPPQEEIPRPSTSGDGERLDLPFSTRVSYFLKLDETSALRINGLDVYGADGAVAGATMRLRIEAAVDLAVDTQVIELTPAQLTAPIEIPLPTEAAGQRTYVALAAYRVDGKRGGDVEGLSIDLPEIVSYRTEPPEASRESSTMATEIAPTPASRPNVLIYIIDTLRADHLGCYGYPVATSPNIDRLAADATVFDRVVAQSSWTRPSVVSVFTGLSPMVHGVNDRDDALAAEALTLAEVLGRAGYETGGIITNSNLSRVGLDQGFSSYENMPEGKHDAIHVLSDRLHDKAVTWLDRRDRTKPFLLYLHATDPHAPYTPPQQFIEQIGGVVGNPKAGLIDNVRQLRRGVCEQSVLDDLIALYDAEIAYNDHHFWRLIAELKQRGLYESTLIILVSDHGEEFFDHGWWKHGKTLYEEQLAVPLIVRYPNGVGAGTRVDQIAQHIDIYPTVLETAGIEVPEALSGRSLTPSRSNAQAAPVEAVAYLNLDSILAESLTTDEGKLILHHNDNLVLGRRLHDLATDRKEQSNLWSQRPILTGYLLSALRAYKLAHQERFSSERVALDEEIEERLKALGYMGS
jgi:arylsulfatase A-like enzyme